MRPAILLSTCALAMGMLTSFVPAGAAAERRVPTIDDLLALEQVGAAQLSPDGSRVACTVTRADFGEDAFVTQIWLVPSAGGEPLTPDR